MSAGYEVLSNPAKLKVLLTSLNMLKYAAIIKGVWDLVMSTSLDIGFTSGVTASIGGLFYFKLAIFLFAIKIVLSIVGGAITLKKVLAGMSGFIKDFISIFTSKKNKNESVMGESISIEESIKSLFITYGYNTKLI